MKPKLIILIALLTVFSFTTKAQSLTFEQTVEYLKGFVKANSIYAYVGIQRIGYLSEISVEKSGRVTMTGRDNTGSFNAFDVATATWSLYGRFSDKDNCLQLLDKDKNIIAVFGYLTIKADADRFYRAIVYLKNVCTKSADPFGN